eukprot:gene3673-biopygen13415
MVHFELNSTFRGQTGPEGTGPRQRYKRLDPRLLCGSFPSARGSRPALCWQNAAERERSRTRTQHSERRTQVPERRTQNTADCELEPPAQRGAAHPLAALGNRRRRREENGGAIRMHEVDVEVESGQTQKRQTEEMEHSAPDSTFGGLAPFERILLSDQGHVI